MGEMSWDVAKAAVEKYAAENASRSGLREVIPSTMGEPLLYSYFEDLMNLCVERDISLNLTTNGTFPGIWGTEEGMRRLLLACSDIKVSSLASECFADWKTNVEKLTALAKGNAAENAIENVATVSLQVTLHKENLMMIPEIIAWAETIGIHRIKWNTAVLLSTAPRELVARFELPSERVAEIRNYVKGFAALGGSVKHEGSLFFEKRGGEDGDAVGAASKCASEAVTRNASEAAATCGFEDELWILPDGTEQHCPNPERRFGNGNAPEAQCCNCPMAR